MAVEMYYPNFSFAYYVLILKSISHVHLICLIIDCLHLKIITVIGVEDKQGKIKNVAIWQMLHLPFRRSYSAKKPAFIDLKPKYIVGVNLLPFHTF